MIVIFYKQKKILLFLVFAITICSSNILAQEARPTDVRPLETTTIAKITPEESERRLQDAKLLFDRGKTDAAIYMLQQLEKSDPTNYTVLFKLGEMAIAAKNWAYAITVLCKASFIRPKDIEVRLILMDVYAAYQMPIQEIIVGKEILVLDMNHVTATRRLAKLYKEQAMPDDEIKIRQKLKHMVPDDYENLKRLADTLYESGELWEAARVYEQICKYYPKNMKDLTQLAAIYDELGETFRGLRTLDQIRINGGKRKWLRDRAVKRLRLENNVYDPFNASLNFEKYNGEEINQFTTTAQAEYLHFRLNSSIDIGVNGKFTNIHHAGRTVLDGRMDIYSSTIAVNAVKKWNGDDYVLGVKLGLLWDEVHGRLRPADDSLGLTSEDFPFLKHPSFSTYGGVMPVVKLNFQAKPGQYITYQLSYEHGLVEDLDARLRMFYFDKTTVGVSCKLNDYTEFSLQADETAFSDGNFRFHALASAWYTLWGSGSVHSYRDSLGIPFWRKEFFRKPPLNYIKFGYTYEYYDDESKSDSYEVYKSEDRHLYQMEAQARLYKLGLDRNIFFSTNLGYSNGSTLDLQQHAGARLFYRDYESGNEIGLSFDYEKQNESNQSAGQSQRISGKGRTNTINAYIKWRF